MVPQRRRPVGPALDAHAVLLGPDVQTAISATNSARRQVYSASARDVGTSTEVAAARMFESQLMPRISTGQWYRNAGGQWVQR